MLRHHEVASSSGRQTPLIDLLPFKSVSQQICLPTPAQPAGARTHQPCIARAEGLEKPVSLVGQAQVRPAQLKQELHQGGGAHEVAEGDHDAQLGQKKLHLRMGGAQASGER